MEKPDFSKYSEEQLRRILNHIDRERFPERVEEIHARLAQFEAEAIGKQGIEQPQALPGPPELAGPGQRMGAFMIDSIVLALIGLFLGLFFSKQFEAMGSWGRIVGYLISTGYFAVFDSRVFRGATPGKRVLGIKVEASAGAPLSFRKSFLRATIISLPYFLGVVNVWQIGGSEWDSAESALLVLLTILIVALGVADSYLILFNRRTRQAVYDLLAGAVVVRKGGTGAPNLSPVWRGHIAMIAVLIVVMAGAGAVIYSKFDEAFLKPLGPVLLQVSREPGVRSANIVHTFAGADRQSESISVTVMTRGEVADQWTLAKRIASTTFNSYPEAKQMNWLTVTMARGYDIGIASISIGKKTFSGTPAQWSKSLAEP